MPIKLLKELQPSCLLQLLLHLWKGINKLGSIRLKTRNNSHVEELSVLNFPFLQNYGVGKDEIWVTVERFSTRKNEIDSKEVGYNAKEMG